MNTKYETIKVEKKDDFVLLTLNRPDKLNALNSLVITELITCLRELNAPELKIKGMIFTGEGDKAFIAGADISEMSSMSIREAQEFAERGQKVTMLLESLPFPVIAAVNGFALGGGCEMAMACDFIFATQTAIFGQPEVKLGLIPGFGGTQRLSNYIGRNRARHLIYSGNNIDVNVAKDFGLVLEIFENKNMLLEASFKTLKKFSRNSPFAIKAAKEVMNLGNDLTVNDGLNIESKKFAEIFGSQDMKEGTTAFIEKRAPQFTGE